MTNLPAVIDSLANLISGLTSSKSQTFSIQLFSIFTLIAMI